MNMKKVKLAVVSLGLALASALALALASGRIKFIWDEFGHGGFYRCGWDVLNQGEVRLCATGMDEPVFSEWHGPDGVVVKSWYALGLYEYKRVIVSGPNERTYFRKMGDDWLDTSGRTVVPK